MILGLFGAALIVFGAVYLGISCTQNLGESTTQISTENAAKSLERITKDITVTKVEPKKGQVILERQI